LLRNSNARHRQRCNGFPKDGQQSNALTDHDEIFFRFPENPRIRRFQKPGVDMTPIGLLDHPACDQSRQRKIIEVEVARKHWSVGKQTPLT
jgi:hypothetical protein